MGKSFAFAATISVVLALAPARAENSSMGWAEVIGELTTQRTKAEVCVGLIKSRGDAAAKNETEGTYVTAKAEIDGVVAELEILLVEGGKPGTLPIRASLEATATSLKAICSTAFATATPNTKSMWDEIAKGAAEGAVEPIVNRIADGIAALWAHYVVDPDKLALETKKAKLEAARWPEFADIAAK
jgi:hypothetical protein